MINKVEKIYFNGVHSNYMMELVGGERIAVPLDEANTDYQAIQEWIADGGTVIDNGGGE
jgi:hypothetical protein